MINISKRVNHWRKAQWLKGKSCELCGFDFWPVLESHHAIPISEGGQDDASNIAVLCPTCHAIVHHFRGHYESYMNENSGGRAVAWQKNTEWQLETYAVELGLNTEQFTALVLRK